MNGRKRRWPSYQNRNSQRQVGGLGLSMLRGTTTLKRISCKTTLDLEGVGPAICYLACIASVSVLFRSKERKRNEILGFGRARNETSHFSRGLYCTVFDSRNSTETLLPSILPLLFQTICSPWFIYFYLFIFLGRGGGWERVGKGQVRVICLVISVFLKLKCLPSFYCLRGRENKKKKWCSLILAPDILSRNISVKIAPSKVYMKYAWLEVTFAWLFQPQKTKYFRLSFGQRSNQRWRPLWWKGHLN